ncbi:UrcA family protein [Qipengyuania sp. CAU 1752]
MRLPLIAFAATASLMAGTPAIAADESEIMVVAYKDLDLSSAEGQRTLQIRIDAAAKKICGVGELQTGSRLTAKSSTKCFREARRIANRHMAAIGNARLGG